MIINSFDKCNRDLAQSNIMELVAKLVIEHSNKIPLLQAFFSCLEFYINHGFSPYSSSHFFSKIKLPMCESDNDNIRCYFHDWLCSLTSADIVWFLKDTLNILVLMVAVL